GGMPASVSLVALIIDRIRMFASCISRKAPSHPARAPAELQIERVVALSATPAAARSVLLRHVLAQLAVTLPSLVLLEVLQLVHRADLDLAGARHRIGAALHPLHRLGHVLDLPEPIACDQLTGLGEGTVDDGALRAVEGHALALT